MEEKTRRIDWKEVSSFILCIAAAVAAAYLVVHFVGQRTVVDGQSMEDTLHHGDNLIVDKISYRFRDPERYDIIVFPHEEEGNTSYYIKRIIGLPGETVQIGLDGTIYIDGEALEESYGRETILDPGQAAEPVVLGKEEYFVLGDNRNNSKDSRVPIVGAIPREDIVGRAWLRVYPFNKIGFIKHQ